MKHLAVILTLSVLLSACAKEPEFAAPGGGLLSENGGSLFYIERETDTNITFYYPGQLSSETNHSANKKSRTFNCQGTLRIEDRTPIRYQYVSSATDSILIDDQDYDLSSGSVFIIKDKGGVTQLPFQGMEGSKKYLDLLNQFFYGNVSGTPSS